MVPKHRDWCALFEMQHYFVPTRLLDWTTSLGVALYFALGGDEPVDNPAIWVLHPGLLNSQALGPEKVGERFIERPPGPLSMDDLSTIDLSYCEDYIGDRRKLPRRPVGITPEAAFPRLRAQRGRFTVHGICVDPLEKQCAHAVIRVVMSNVAIEQIRDRTSLTGIDAFSIFPDAVGLAHHLKRRHGLSEITNTKSLVLHFLKKRDN